MPYIGRSSNFAVRTVFTYTPSAGDTSVSGGDVDGKILHFIDGRYAEVYLNGVKLKLGTDYNTDTADTIAGLTALAANDEIEVVVYDSFNVSDTVSATTGGTFTGAVVFAGGFQGDAGNLTLKDTATADGSSPTLTLQTGDTDIAVDDVLGTIAFQAPDEGAGTDAILVAASIAAVSEGDFSSSNNATSLQFLTAASAAVGTGGGRMIFNSGANLLVKDLDTADGSSPTITLQTGDTDIAADDVLGSINFQAPDEGAGTDAILVAAGIAAISEGNFSSSNNATKLVFKTGASESAASKFEIASDGSLSTPTLGTSNVRFGVNAGDAIVSGGNYNVCLGDESGTGLTTGDRNVTVGFSAGKLATTPNDLIAIGYEAGGGAVLTGANNILLGTDAGHDLTSGAGNVFIGTETGDKTDDGAGNVGIGLRALGANCGNSNVAIGDTALAVTTSAENTAVGSGAGSSLTDVSGGVFVGQHSGLFATTASNSTFVGHSAGQGITGAKLTGNDNTAVGTNAGLLLQGAGTTNTLIGKDAGKALTTNEQVTIVGAGAGLALTGSKNTLIGADSGNAITSGIKNTVLGRFNGNQEIDLRETDNRIVISDGDGNIGLYMDNNSQAFFGDMDLDTDGAAMNAQAVGTAMAGNFYQDDTGDSVLVKMRHARANTGNSALATMISFCRSDGGERGSIKVNGIGATSFNTSSDYRLKENVDYNWDATTRLKQLKPARFNFIADADTTVDGFLAHEAATVVPDAVIGVKDATHVVTNVVLSASDEVVSQGITEESWTKRKADILYKENDIIPDGKSVGDVRKAAKFPSDSKWVATHTLPLNQQIDHSKIVPLLVKTIQELEARITTLEG